MRAGDHYVLDGVKSLVPVAGRAELFVVAAEVVVGGHGVGLRCSWWSPGRRGCRSGPEPAMGLRAAETGRLHLEGRPGAGHGPARRRRLRADVPECVRLSRLAWCALAVGTGQAVVDYVIPYVNDRVAFGEPISTGRLAFAVADMATELDGMRLATYRAASQADQGLDFSRQTALARRLCSEHGMRIGSDGVQLLGGHGYVRSTRWSAGTATCARSA